MESNCLGLENELEMLLKIFRGSGGELEHESELAENYSALSVLARRASG